MIEDLRKTTDTCEIAVVGKYTQLHDAYKSIYESLAHAGIANGCKVKIRKVRAEDYADQGAALIEGCDGLLIPGGFGERGVEGKIKAIRHARETGLPFFGICLGMQCATIEFARNVLKLDGANTEELDPQSPHPVIHLMADQANVHEKGGTMRLGACDCSLVPGTLAQRLYKASAIRERHRHRFEYNNAYRARFEAAGLVTSGVNPQRDLVEIVELKNHPFFIGVQFHPEFKSKPLQPHPVFDGFVAAALAHARGGTPTNKTERSRA
jgi:CTP synthase